MTTHKKWKPLIFPALLCTILWGSAAPFVKMGYSLFQIDKGDSFSQLVFAGWRFLSAGLLTLVFAALSGHKPLLPTKHNIRPILCISLFQSMIQYVCYYIGLSRTAASNAALLSGTQTFFALIFAHIILQNDKLNRNKAIGCVLGFLGAAALQLGGALGAFTFMGDGLLLISAASAGMGALVSRVLTKGQDPIILTAWQLIFGGSFLLTIGYGGGGSLTVITPQGISLLCYLVLLSSVAFSVWTSLLKKHSVSKVTVFNFLIPPFGALTSAIVLGENLRSFRHLFAFALVSTGIILSNIVPTEKSKNNSKSA